MTLTLRIINSDVPNSGASPELVLNSRGANIGRALTCEWVLPDDGRVVSSRHCEVQFRDNVYFLVDYGSTNGTFVGQSDQPLVGTHRIAPGDRFRIGPYTIEARLAGAALQQHESEVAEAAAAAQGTGYGDWHDVPGARPSAPPAPPPPTDFGGWDLPEAAPDKVSVWSEDVNRGSGGPSADDIFGNFTAKNEVDWNNAAWSVDPDFDPFADPLSEPSGFAPLPGSATPAPGAGDPFAPLGGSGGATESRDPFAPLPGAAAAPAPPPPPSPAAAPGGGFAPLPGSVPPSPPPSPATGGGSFAPLDPAAPPATPPSAAPWPDLPASTPPPTPSADPWGQPAAAPPPEPTAVPSAMPPMRVLPSPVPHAPEQPPAQPAAAPPPAAAPAPLSDAVFGALLSELGVPASQLKLSPEETAAKTGRMLRHLIAGLMILLEARARAKEEMGAAGTALSFDGNNPLKFARNVDQALAMMLNPHLRGYMEAEDGIEEAYRDLQAHQIATLKAMQGALRETLGRFSPTAIKARTKEQGLLAKVLPGQREAALWKAYEAQFSGVAEGSAEAFLEVFSREFRRAYEETSRRPR
ncbi:type VI secretion system-associated FHA domain protein TagH [Porphyrobacter sp. YT40]|uniref:type VI secretion system-associated FHA domain protein TagH n=1 Tax=Porphyrobacter sp. YT40 TaxID=2547601 RepID=UPI0011435A45|nr:type VI secretion system-associated FHA domain protein TagH [Porphyrobacter sp. YT40]QDH33045.1 type VI secretion system-associated FHA domain protein TagH [Porphyrobacter sp. YT40]